MTKLIIFNFQFSDKAGQLKNGWYEYSDLFLNVLIALDDFTLNNGALEVSQVHPGDFAVLIKNTKMNGSPDLLSAVANQCAFYPVLVPAGSLVFFRNNVPHRSGPNLSSGMRRSVYYTYCVSESLGEGVYERYFADKRQSTSKLKALSDGLVE